MTLAKLAFNKPRLAPRPESQVPTGRFLIQTGQITPTELFSALEQQREVDATVAELLRARAVIDEHEALAAMAHQYGAEMADLDRHPPDRGLTSLAPPMLALKHAFVPWRRLGDHVIVATSRPDRFEQLRDTLPEPLATALIAVAPEAQIQSHLETTHRTVLTETAETRVAPHESFRNWEAGAVARGAGLVLVLAALAVVGVLAPVALGGVIAGWALFSLIAATIIKILAFFARPNPWRPARPAPLPPATRTGKLPRISVMVPLFREENIASHLIARLQKLTYPKVLLDVLLVLEEGDDTTAATIAATRLPPWMRVVTVPRGSGLTTKPRALNYALDFCKGDLVGVWDAEDAPEPDQLERVARYFEDAGEKTACVQGILDYYNPDANWLARCFTLEYASWFRVVLPGLRKMGIPIPLGGTTMFLRRDAIEKVGGWDAHNVTEDADLGMRLARHGLRTDMVETVTYEEATCRPWAWIRQRSRWLKGYMVTYLVHMRRPRQLRAQLGWRGFLGFQAVFLVTLSQFLLAPVIWSFWTVPFGLPHPVVTYLGPTSTGILAGVLAAVGVVNLTIAIVAMSGQGRARLVPWALTLGFYFSLACIAGYKGLVELVAKPFFWDKTSHGHSLAANPVHDPVTAGQAD